MKSSVEELVNELLRLEECDKVLSQLFFHHQSQSKHPEVNTVKYHRELCDKIQKAKGKSLN
jgi:hypothetical protein